MTTRKARADRAEGAFKPAERIARADHHDAAEAVREKTARLRAQRLAKEAAGPEPMPAPAAPKAKRWKT